MAFTLIDMESWKRKEHYLHFINEVRCTYSTSVNIDISNLNGYRLYPTMIWLLTQTVNSIPEFRTALTSDGLGIYEQMHPAYTIFNQEQKTFSGIWTEFHSDYLDFLYCKSWCLDFFSVILPDNPRLADNLWFPVPEILLFY